MPTDYEAPASRELVAPAQPTGFLTQPKNYGLSPAMMAEQQRVKSEIEASLTIAAARPRDEKAAMDAILISCQRPGLAAKSQYQYSRGGTDISGASIVLMEAIAQRYGNIEFGFRELARHPARGSNPGESVVEAFAWDLQSNTKRKIQFSVEHAMKAHGKVKMLSDPRDIYEYISNQAQRRVRTCLENIIPRDIVEDACEECDRTLRANIQDIEKATADMLKAFGDFGVSREMIEGRIQRRIDSITPAQIIGLRKIYRSIKDGMSEAGDWFTEPAKDTGESQEAPPKATSVAEKAKAKMRQAKAAKTPEEPAPEPAPETETTPPESAPEAPEVSAVNDQEVADVDQWLSDLQSVNTLIPLQDALTKIPENWSVNSKKIVAVAIGKRIEEVRGSRGKGSNKPAREGTELFDANL